MATARPGDPGDRGLIMIVWRDAGGDNVNTLAFDSGRGLVRVYCRDRYDPRLDMGRANTEDPLPFFEMAHVALAWMKGHPGQQCQVTLQVGVKLGWSREEMAREPDFLRREAPQEAPEGSSGSTDTSETGDR